MLSADGRVHATPRNQRSGEPNGNQGASFSTIGLRLHRVRCALCVVVFQRGEQAPAVTLEWDARDALEDCIPRAIGSSRKSVNRWVFVRLAGALSLAFHEGQFNSKIVDTMARGQRCHEFAETLSIHAGPFAATVSAAQGSSEASQHHASDTARALHVLIDGTLLNHAELERHLRTASALRVEAPTVAELVLAAYTHWGEGCFARLAGIFAIVVLDQEQQQCLLVRDQFGAKPLHYTIVGPEIAFASECKPLLALHPVLRPNQRALLEFALHGDVMPPATLYEEICSIPSGHYVRIGRNGQVQLQRYFNPFDVVNEASYDRLLRLGAERFLDELDALLHQSIAQHMAQGGPFGVALSGGVDSATLTAIAARYGDIRAINVSVPHGHKLDERPMAQAVAAHVGVPLSVVTMSGELYRSELANATWANEMPLWHVQNLGVYLACRRARELGIRALLCGDTIGMMLSPSAQLQWKRLYPLLTGAHAIPALLPQILTKVGYAFAQLPLDSDGFGWYLPLAVQLIDGYARATHHKQAEEKYAFVTNRTRRKIHGSKLAEVHGFYSRFFCRGDRLGNVSGVEYRTPFGEVDALKFAMNMPYAYMVREGTKKWSIKALGSRRYIPREIAFRKKVAWNMPGEIYLSPLATPAFFRDGYCVHTMGLSSEAISLHLDHWLQEPNRLSRMIHMEVWGRLFMMGDSAAQLTERIMSFG